ncbi:sodium-coupled monocarboxylate transporter 1-like [Centruroides vittatus]|uniref:sodium-coupled monocarboxylate transporter 1-like n=1 Tax=Centruroides vittatus TaxID=120091 RepID=UPI00350FB9A7
MDTVTVEDNADNLAKRFGVYDYVVFAATLSVSAIIGIYYAFKGQKTTKDILMGGKSMSVFPVSMSVLASFMSAITLLGTPAEMYTYGTQYFMIIISYALLIPAASYFYLPIFYKLELTSVYEYLEKRFSKTVRTLASIAFSIQMLIYMSIVLYAPSLALSQVTGIAVWTSVLSIGVVCTFYTTIGGIKAVIWTDLFQVLMMFAAMFAVAIKGVSDEGGIEKVWKINDEGGRIEFWNFDTSPLTRHTVWGLAIGGYFTWLAIYAVNQSMVQRYLSIPTLSKAQSVIIINFPGLSLLLSLTCVVGLAIYAKYKDCDPIKSKQVTTSDQLLPLFVMDVLGEISGIPGLFVAGIFSGALSTVSSGVNSLSAVTLEDVVKAYIKPNISEVWAARSTKIFAVAYGILAILLVLVAEQLGDVLPAALSIFGMVGGPVLGLFTLGMFFPWPNATGAISGFITGLILPFWIGFGYFIHKPYIPKLPISLTGCSNRTSIISNITTTLMTTVSTSTEYTTTSMPVHYEGGIQDLYRISYIWYSAIGCTTVVVVGLIVSFLTGPKQACDMDPALFSPFFETIFFWLPLKFRRHLRFGVLHKNASKEKVEKGNSFNVFQISEKGMDEEKMEFSNGIANLSYTPSSSDLTYKSNGELSKRDLEP